MKGAILALSLMLSSTAYSQLAEYAEGSNKVQLYSESGPCVKEARWALYIQGSERISGCWIVIPPAAIQVSWLDGDISRFPIEIFTKPKTF